MFRLGSDLFPGLCTVVNELIIFMSNVLNEAVRSWEVAVSNLQSVLLVAWLNRNKVFGGSKTNLLSGKARVLFLV